MRRRRKRRDVGAHLERRHVRRRRDCARRLVRGRQQLYRPVQPDDGLLPFTLGSAALVYRQGGPDELRQVQWAHPVLTPLRDPVLGELTQCKFLKYAALEGKPAAAASRPSHQIPRQRFV